MSNQSDQSKGKDQDMKCWTKDINHIKNWLTHKDKDKKKDEWLKDMRGMLSLVATVIATISFQSAMNPPGGIRSAEDSGVLPHFCNRTETNPCPGESVLAVVKEDNYIRFLYCNTVCFVASSAVCLLLVSGLPLDTGFFTWLFSIGMCITLTSLTLTYLYGLQMVTPIHVWPTYSIFSMFGVVIFIWMLLLGLVALFLSIRLVFRILTSRNDKPSQPPEVQP